MGERTNRVIELLKWPSVIFVVALAIACAALGNVSGAILFGAVAVVGAFVSAVPVEEKGG